MMSTNDIGVTIDQLPATVNVNLTLMVPVASEDEDTTRLTLQQIVNKTEQEMTENSIDYLSVYTDARGGENA